LASLVPSAGKKPPARIDVGLNRGGCGICILPIARFLQTKLENTMTLRIAIIAACAGTFALAQTNLAQAAYAGAAESKNRATIANVWSDPAIVVATLINTSHSNIRHPGVKKSRTSKGSNKGKQGIIDGNPSCGNCTNPNTSNK
jgi:hypothetical protein